MQSYRVDVGVAQVIIGNEVLLKCDIPSFATDYVSVSDWVDSEGFSYSRENNLGKSYLNWLNKYKKFRESTCKKFQICVCSLDYLLTLLLMEDKL